jgi:hypothetical protein
MLMKPLTAKDVQDSLKRLSAAIELDQVAVDSLAPERFSSQYDDGLWRTWRHDHRGCIEKLLATASAIKPFTLQRLNQIATSYEPRLVGEVLLELFAEVVSGSSAEDYSSVELFFKRLIHDMAKKPRRSIRHQDARSAILSWRPLSDPLQIAQDPECAYGEVRLR